MLSSYQITAATKIQKIFRSYQARKSNATQTQEKQLFCTIDPKQIITEKMKIIRSEITSSATAAHSRKEDFQSPFGADFSDFYDRVIYNIDGSCTVENLTMLLQEGYHAKSMLCHDLAMYLSVTLRNDPVLPASVKDEIFICKIDNHTFVCIGNPNQEDKCYVADVWISYFNSELPSSGVLLPVQEYKAILKSNPNDYVRHDSLFKIDILDKFTEITKAITPEMIRNSCNAYDVDGKTHLLLAIENEQIDVLQDLLKNPALNVNKVDKNTNETPLLKSIKKDNIEMVKLLLSHPGLDLKKKSPHSANGKIMEVDAWGYACRYHDRTGNRDAILDFIEAHS